MKKKFKFIIPVMILVLIGITAGLMAYHKPHRSVAKATPDFVTDATVLYDEFVAQEERANEKYLDKIVMVKGVVKDVSKVADDRINITLETGDEIFGVSCTFDSNADSLLSVKKGEIINLKGICTGMLMDVVLINCVAVNS